MQIGSKTSMVFKKPASVYYEQPMEGKEKTHPARALPLIFTALSHTRGR
jgi:hypothetical protein